MESRTLDYSGTKEETKSKERRLVVTLGHEIKIRLLLGRKAMTNLDSIFKSRDITLPMKSV